MSARSALRRYAAALPLARNQLSHCRATLGDTHTTTLIAMMTLGRLYKSTGDFAAALPLHR